MADRTSAALFGKIFTYLSNNLTEESKKFAEEMYTYAGEFDFSPYQMDSDDALLKLGLAKIVKEDNDNVIEYK